MPLVSVIIPVYNGEKYIEEAMNSVYAQTFRDFELIVINDGSTDCIEGRLEKYRNRMIYLAQENRGISAARNHGLQVARGTLIAFLDADDIWLPQKLERQVEFARAHPEYGIVAADVEAFDKRGILNCSVKNRYPISNGYVMEKLLFYNWIGTSAAMVQRECFEKVGTFDEEPGILGEDWMMWVRIAAQYPIYFIDEVLVRHRVHPESISHSDPEAQFLNLFRNLEKLRTSIPQLATRPDLIREASYRIAFNRGLADLQGIKTRRAQDKLWRAIRYKPYALQAWVLCIASYSPPWVLRGAKQLVRFRRHLAG